MESNIQRCIDFEEGKMKSRIESGLCRFAQERDEALIEFVKTGDDTLMRKHCAKYGQKVPKSRKVFHAAMYKSVRYCTNIPADIKALAWEKCLELGFSPINPELEG